jgi:hypothetical protein
MPAPLELPNQARILRGVEWLLQRITHANDFYTDGLVLDRDRDPTSFLQNRPREYAERYNAGVILRLGERKLQRERAPLGQHRWRQTLYFYCVRTITDRTGLALTDLEAMLKEDVEHALDYDTDLQKAGAALHALEPTKGYDSISCMNLTVEEDTGTPTIIAHPDSYWVMVGTCLYDEPRRVTA